MWTINYFVKVLASFSLVLITVSAGISQVVKPVEWVFEVQNKTHDNSDVVVLGFHASIDKTWHIYSNVQSYKLGWGPMPSKFTFREYIKGKPAVALSVLADEMKYEAPGQKAGFLSRIIRYDLDRNYVHQQSEVLQNITKAELDYLAGKYLPVDKMDILVVGDRSVIGEGLERLGYEIIELDTRGKPKVRY